MDVGLPSLLLLLRLEIQDSRFAGRQVYLHRIHRISIVGISLVRDILDKGPSEAVHHSVISFTLSPVAEEFVVVKHCPVRFEAVALSLKEALALKCDVQIFLD